MPMTWPAIAAAAMDFCVPVEKSSSDTRRAIQSVARSPNPGGWKALADLVRLSLPLPQLAVKDAAKSLEGGIKRAAAKPGLYTGHRPPAALLTISEQIHLTLTTPPKELGRS